MAVIIPYYYAVLPIIEERRKKYNSDTNRLSENTFTDRRDDLQNLIDLLNKNYVIQLTGNDSQCGKSWLAIRLYDYVKHPKDLEFHQYRPLKRRFKNAFYIDLADKDDTEINEFFNNHVITNKTLIIVDHVKNIDYIFSKADLYKFSLIFVTTNYIGTKGVVYYISDFNQDNVPELQRNINHNYTHIELLNKSEINTLYDLTFGNIGKIHFLLERQEYVAWIKQIAQNKQTEYDKKLNNIQVTLFRGEYTLSKNALDDFHQQYKEELKNNYDLYFKFYIMKSDCEHLLNNYQNALDILIALKKEPLKIYNKNYKMDILEAHYYKHLWQCDESLIILQGIQKYNICGLTDALGILVAKYFIDDLFVPNMKSDSLSVFLNTFEKCKNSSLQMQDKDRFKIMRNESIYLYYKKKYKKIFQPINKVIEIYKNENNRLLANAYFVRAELNRLSGKYKNALLDYNRCLSNTEDNNIKIQVNIMKYYLAKIKKEKPFKSDNHLSKDELVQLCKNKNRYGMLLIQRINSIELEDPNKEEIMKCFDERIMTIL